ncbi:hypothetical protein BGZ74_009905 [Mortierella antarctica]|nr:hypothetical protein BGZ74_009905 [Mortierella antarctica]
MSRPILPMSTEEKPTGSPALTSTPAPTSPSPPTSQLPGDCLPCKLVGCAGFGGLGLYSYYQAAQLPKTLVARRLGLVAMGTGFIGAAVYRLTMPIPPPPPSDS